MSSYANVMANAFQSELVKIAAKKQSGLADLAKNKYLLGAGGGILGFHALTKAEQDRRLGRRLRMQSR